MISGYDILIRLYFSKYSSKYITVAKEALITHIFSANNCLKNINMYLKITYLEIFLIESDLSCMNGACQHVDAVIFHRLYFVILYRKRVFFPNDYVKRRLCIAPQMSCSTMPNSCCHGNVCRCNLWGQNCR